MGGERAAVRTGHHRPHRGHRAAVGVRPVPNEDRQEDPGHQNRRRRGSDHRRIRTGQGGHRPVRLPRPSRPPHCRFEDDPEAVKALVAAAKTGQFDHTLQRLRDARAENQRRADLEDRVRQEGTLLVENPTWQNTTKYLADLRTDDGREALTIEGHQDCPGHAACLATQWGYLDPVTGALIAEAAETAEDDSEEQDTARPQWTSLLTIRYVCTDPLQYGHHSRYPDAHTPAARPKLADMSEDEQQAARAQRRDVIESDRAWTSAERVRRTWLRTFVARKTPPKGSAAFLAEAVAADADLLARIGGNQLAANILGCEKKGFGRNTQMATLAAQASEQRAQVIVLAQVLAAYEDATIRDHWRHRAEHTTRTCCSSRPRGTHSATSNAAPADWTLSPTPSSSDPQGGGPPRVPLPPQQTRVRQDSGIEPSPVEAVGHLDHAPHGTLSGQVIPSESPSGVLSPSSHTQCRYWR